MKPTDKKTNKTITVSYKHLSKWVLLILLALILAAFFTGSKSLFDLYDLYKERNQLLEAQQMLQSENKQLLKEIERLQNNLEAIEKVARERYNLKRKDEIVYKVVPEKSKDE